MKSRTTILSIVLVISLFVILVWAFPVDTDINNVALIAPITGKNISGPLTFNVTAFDLRAGDGTALNLTSDGNITSINLSFSNASNMSRQDITFQVVLGYRDITLNTTFNNATDALNPGLRLGKDGALDTNNSVLSLTDGYYNITNISADFSNGTSNSLRNQTVLKNADGTPITMASGGRIGLLIIDNTVPQLVGWNASDRSNYSGTNEINLTVTVTNNTGDLVSGTDIHKVTIQISNGSKPFNLTATLKNGGASLAMNRSYNLSFNWSNYGMTDRGHKATLFVNDTAGNFNSSKTINFTIDTNSPELVGWNISDRSNYTGRGEVNMTVTVGSYGTGLKFIGLLQSVADIDKVTIQISNNSSPFNLTATLKNGGIVATNRSYNLSFNWTELGMLEGNHTATLFVNDTVGNMNDSEPTRTFILDVTNPTATVTCTPATVEIGAVVTCTCLGLDKLGSNSTGVNSSGILETTLADSGVYQATTAGTFTSATCTATDIAGLSGTATGSYTVTAAATSGSGSGGSGGGSSSGVQGQSEKKTWASILAGEKASVAVKNGVLGVTSIEFVVQKTTYGATLSVKKVDSLPSTVEAFAQKAYKTLQITESNVEKALSGPAVISFKVEKKWLADNKLAASQVAMHHFKDGQWAELTTTAGQDDGTYVHFTAETPGFSYFVIGQKEGTAPAPAAAGAAAPAEQPVDVTELSATEEVSEPSSSSTAVWVVVGLVLLALVAWAVVSMKKRR